MKKDIGKILLLNTQLKKIGLDARPTKDGISIGLKPLYQLKLKQKRITASSLKNLFVNHEKIKFSSSKLTITANILKSDFNKISDFINCFVKTICEENIFNDKISSVLNIKKQRAFDTKKESQSKHQLDLLYQSDYIVAEKKPFVVDLNKSIGPYLVSVDKPENILLDGAGQIASLAVGMNHPSKNQMVLRGEINNKALNLEFWDVSLAYKRLLQEQSGLKNVYFVNSGAEAIETALSVFQKKYVNRNKIISFEGSFHGRTLLSLHSTHSPEKRQPFEIFKNIVDFVPYPEITDASVDESDPELWIQTWSNPLHQNFLKNVENYLVGGNKTIIKEVTILLKINSLLKKEARLAVIIEPMQCEGGDRYASGRFYRALRLLTRAYDTPLIIDEVQTGFGLGGEFFWHKKFKFITKSKDPDYPDAICIAKKAQVGACLSSVEIPYCVETSAASLFRGYIHAQQMIEIDYSWVEKKVKLALDALEKCIGNNIILKPRACGLCFSFDLPSAKLLTELISVRFSSGLMFYPAGTKTARFRLVAETSPEILINLFNGIYNCFLQLSKKNHIPKITSENLWNKELSKIFNTSKNQKNNSNSLIDTIPINKSQYLKMTPKGWYSVLKYLLYHYPQVSFSKECLSLTLEDLNKFNQNTLWEYYINHPKLTYIEFLWLASRSLGSNVVSLSSSQVGNIRNKIDALEKAVYEPSRQDDPEMFYQQSKGDKSITLAVFNKKNDLIGFCAASSLSNFKHLKLVDTDPQNNDPNALYSSDLTIHPSAQGKGLGLRLKLEQFIAAKQNQASCIKSRNRIPEATKMSRLNQLFGAVVQDLNHNDYEGSATCYYQSIQFDNNFDLSHSNFGILKNKTTLSNFVSDHFIANLYQLKSYIPKPYQHIYLASGRAECVDKMIKLLIKKRPDANLAMSFDGDFFGQTTACARSLGNLNGKFFDWPIIPVKDKSNCGNDEISELISAINNCNPSKILGIFINPINDITRVIKSKRFLDDVINLGKIHKIPVIFHESIVSAYKYNQKFLFASGNIFKPDAMLFYPGGQLGFVCVKKSLFFSDPLKMISTWDGDEYSLNNFVKGLL
mgnify:CR=1 FL=1